MKRNFILWAIGAFALAAICFGQPPPVNYTLQPNFIFNDGDFTMSVAIADFDLDGDLDAVFGNYDYPYEFDGDNPVNEMRNLIAMAPGLLSAERRRLATRNRELNYGASATARAFRAALLGRLRPQGKHWPLNLLTYGEPT